MSSSSSHSPPQHVPDSATDEGSPPPSKRRRLNGTQQKETGHRSRYEGPISLRDSHAIIGDVYEMHNHIQPAAPLSEQAKTKQLIDSLAFTRMDARLHNVTTALKNTCQWLFRHQAFRAWMDDSKLAEHRGFLWIKGKPGCGKSTLMKGAYNWAKGKAKKQWITLSYFFNARAPGALEKSPLGLYRSLVHEILRVVPQSVALFDEAFSWKHFSDDIDWTVEELQEFVVRFIEAAWRPPAVIFIDALDEGDVADIRALLSFLEDLIDHSPPNVSLRICLSSRHYPHITIKTGLSLIVEKQSEHEHDIEKYVNDKLVYDLDAGAEKLRAAICTRSAGIFLWVCLVIPILNRLHDQGRDANEMMMYLERLPKDLEGLFAEILARDAVEVRACVSLLQWVLYSNTSLSSTQLYLAIQHSWPRADGDVVTIPNDAALAKYILHHSRGLVEITNSKPPVAQFIHETVREFLAGDRGLAQVDLTLAANLPGWSHARLAQTCLSYFIQNCSHPTLTPQNMAETETSKKAAKSMREALIKESVPFLSYAVANLLVHAEAAQLCGISQQLLLECLQTADGSLDSNFCYVHNLLEKHAVRRYNSDVTLLYLLAERDFPALVTTLLTWESPPVNKRCGRYGNALQAACFGGSVEIVRALLQSNADINALGGEYLYPLRAAILSKHCHLTLVQSLVDEGANVHHRTRLGRTILDDASGLGRLEVVKFLLDRGTNIDGRDRYNSTALIQASLNGRLEVVKLLLDRGADINCLDNYDRTALHVASGSDRLEIVRLLLDRGANVNWPSEDSWTALHQATLYGRLEVVKLLLDRGADINCSDRHGRTALHMASGRGGLEIVKLLLDRGANVNCSDNDGETALHCASRQGHLEVIMFLLDRGADINAEASYCSPLDLAQTWGWLEAVQLLEERGAKITTTISTTT